MSSVTVIVPSLAGAGRLPRTLDSLRSGGAAPATIVVDNGSPGAAVSEASAGFDFVEVVRLEENAGFSRAVNRGVAEAEGDAIVLLNDDCVCDPGFVGRIVEPLAPASGVVMAAGVLRDSRDGSLIDTAGIEIDHTLLAFDYLNGEPLTRLDEGPPDPIGPCAAAAAYDREAFLEAGGFDEALFAYWEDVDLALRLRLAGGSCALAPAARGVHHHSATLGSGSARKDYLMGFGRGYVMRKWGGVTLRRLPAILARDVPICTGQLILDRSAAGVRGRVRGLRAARLREPYPAQALAGARASGLGATLRRRARRRWRVRWRRTRI